MIKKIIVGVLLFIAIFVGTAFITNYINYSGYEGTASEMTGSTLPLAYEMYEGTVINRMQAYKNPIDTSLVRDEIVPIGQDKTVHTLLVGNNMYNNAPMYELRSLDGENLIEEGELELINETEQGSEYQASIRMEIETEKEYVFVVKLTNDNEEYVRYYSRIVQLDRNHLQDSLDLVNEISDSSFVYKNLDDDMSVSAEDEIKMDYLQSLIDKYAVKKNQNTSDLAKVDFNSSVDILTWGNLNPTCISEKIPSIKEIDENNTSIQVKYIISSASLEEEREYLVTEYYELSYDNGTAGINISGFERRTSEIFQEKCVFADDNSVDLGVRNQDELYYRTSPDLKKVGIVSDGELWFYNYLETRITNVYGSWLDKSFSAQEIDKDYGIAISEITDDAKMYFVVYGRINKGQHEGENGIVLYQFDFDDYTTTELLFVKSNIPYTLMKTEVEKYVYYDAEDRYLYVLLDGSIQKINTKDGEIEKYAEDMRSGQIFVSKDGKMLAFTDNSDQMSAKEVKIYNFQDGIKAEYDSAYDNISIIGYINDDIVIGETDSGHVSRGANGLPLFRYKSVSIIDGLGNVIKEYSRENVYINKVQVEEDRIYLYRDIEFGDGTIQEIDEDYITYKPAETKKALSEKLIYRDKGYNHLNLVYPSSIYVRSTPVRQITKTKGYYAGNRITINDTSDSGIWYTFSNSGIRGTYLSVGDAINDAKTNSGVVIESTGKIVYRAKENASYYTVAGTFEYIQAQDEKESFYACCYMSILSAGYTPDLATIKTKSSWEEAFLDYDGIEGMNLSGVNLDTALGWLSDGKPFAVKLTDRYVLVVSYNSTHIRYYDPILGEEVRVKRKDFEKEMDLNGDEVYSY